MIDTLVVLGASGDLTGRLLLPALAALRADAALEREVRFVGAAQEDWTRDEFADHARRGLTAHAPTVSAADRDALVAGLDYRRADVTDPGEVAGVLDLASAGSRPVAVYLSLPTQLMLDAVAAVQAYGLPAGSRIAVEKPFGWDAPSAADLNAALVDVDATPDQPAVYRIDHALAMTGVQNLRRARVPGTDRPIEWSSRQIVRVELLWEETLALEGRASFYDRAGALRDVMQNHLAQLLSVLAGPPSDAATTAERRAGVLGGVRPPAAADLAARTRRARYTAGRLADGGRGVPDYAAEVGVDPARRTETFAEVELDLGAPQWAGTAFVLRAGKALDRRRRGALVHLRPGGGTDPEPIWLDLDAPAAARDDAPAAEPVAYRRILADLLAGGSTFAVSAAETELAWRVFGPVLDAWADDLVPLTTYPAGSSGP